MADERKRPEWLEAALEKERQRTPGLSENAYESGTAAWFAAVMLRPKAKEAFKDHPESDLIGKTAFHQGVLAFMQLLDSETATSPNLEEKSTELLEKVGPSEYASIMEKITELLQNALKEYEVMTISGNTRTV